MGRRRACVRLGERRRMALLQGLLRLLLRLQLLLLLLLLLPKCQLLLVGQAIELWELNHLV